MNKLLKWLSSILFLFFVLHSCVYHHMTHMNEEEEWITNRHGGNLCISNPKMGQKIQL